MKLLIQNLAIQSLVILFGLILGLVLLSCTVQNRGVNIETSVDASECEQSGSENCVVDLGTSGLELSILSDNPHRPFSPQGDCIANENNPDP